MKQDTGDETADFLLSQIKFLRRVGSESQKTAANKWERIVREHAEPEQQPMAASFATESQQKPEGVE